MVGCLIKHSFLMHEKKGKERTAGAESISILSLIVADEIKEKDYRCLTNRDLEDFFCTFDLDFFNHIFSELPSWFYLIDTF